MPAGTIVNRHGDVKDFFTVATERPS